MSKRLCVSTADVCYNNLRTFAGFRGTFQSSVSMVTDFSERLISAQDVEMQLQFGDWTGVQDIE